MHYKTEQEKQDKEFEKKYAGEYDIINDSFNEPYITGVMDEGLYSVDGLLDEVRSHLLSRDQALREAILKDVGELLESIGIEYEDYQRILSLLKDYKLNE